MDWRKAGMLAVLLVVGTGCPEEWGKGGVIDRAVAKDVKENLPQPACSDGRPRQKICPDRTKPDECFWECPK